MNITRVSVGTSTMKKPTLLQGEYTFGTPPTTQLNGEHCVPQHYLQYQHTLETVESLIIQLHFDKHFPIFAAQDDSGIYIQIGIIGVDNYLPKEQQQAKIVYGRKWRVEPNLPTSEIIQTVLLALKTAREHEIRELFKLKTQCTDEQKTRVTTPFNNHHDLPLLVKSYSSESMLYDHSNEQSWHDIQQQLEQVQYDGVEFYLHHCQRLSGETYLVEIEILKVADISLPELNDKQFLAFTVEQLNFNQVLFELMAQLVNLSNRYVEENFTFQDIPRFSRQYDISAIADLSIATRQLHKNMDSGEFNDMWLQSNYETDLTRVPSIRKSPLNEKLMEQLQQLGPITGALPF